MNVSVAEFDLVEIRHTRIRNAYPLTTLPPVPVSEMPKVVSLRSRMATGIIWNLVALGSNQGSTFVVNIVIANILGRALFGEYAMVVSTILSASLLAQLATGLTATKYLAEYRSTNAERAGRVLGLCTIVSTVSAVLSALLFLAGASWIGSSVLKAPQLTPALMICSGFLALSVLNGFQMGVLAGLESYEALGKASLTGGVITVLTCAGMTYLLGLNGAVIGLLVSASVKWALFQHEVRKAQAKHGIRTDYRNMGKESRIFFHFALPAGLIGFSMAPSPWLANSFLVRQPGGFTQMALFASSYSFVAMVLFLPRVIDRVAMSIINHQKGIGEERGYKNVFRLNVSLAFASVVIVGGVIAIFGASFLRLFGRSFAADGYHVLLILLLSAIPEGLCLAIIQVMQSKEKMWSTILAIYLPRDICFPFLAYFLVSNGAVGLAQAYLFSQILAFSVTVFLASCTGLSLQTRSAVA